MEKTYLVQARSQPIHYTVGVKLTPLIPSLVQFILAMIFMSSFHPELSAYISVTKVLRLGYSSSNVFNKDINLTTAQLITGNLRLDEETESSGSNPRSLKLSLLSLSSPF